MREVREVRSEVSEVRSEVREVGMEEVRSTRSGPGSIAGSVFSHSHVRHTIQLFRTARYDKGLRFRLRAHTPFSSFAQHGMTRV